jgi:SAM-dependent methyltransferase
MSPNAYTEMAQIQDQHWWFVARRKILRREIVHLNLPNDAAILEVGSGTGANLSLLSEFGRVMALEMSAKAIALARDRADFDASRIATRQGRCPEDLNSLSEQFDLICLFDVLEHIEDDDLSLSRLKTLLKPGGTLMLTVPAYSWMWGPHDVHLHHKRRYSKARLLADCARAGLSIQRASYFNTLLFPLAVVARLFERIMGKQSSSASRIPQRVVNTFLTSVFSFERLLLHRMTLPFGLSLLAMAQASPLNPLAPHPAPETTPR